MSKNIGKNKIAKMEFKKGDCFISKETMQGKSLVRIITDVKRGKVHYQNSDDKCLFVFTKAIFRFILSIDGSEYVGRI